LCCWCTIRLFSPHRPTRARKATSTSSDSWAIDWKEILITQIVCVTPVGWMDDSEYSDDDTIQELLLDAHQPVVVEKRAVESTRTYYRAQLPVKNGAKNITRANDDEDDLDLDDEHGDTQNKKQQLRKRTAQRRKKRPKQRTEVDNDVAQSRNRTMSETDAILVCDLSNSQDQEEIEYDQEDVNKIKYKIIARDEFQSDKAVTRDYMLDILGKKKSRMDEEGLKKYVIATSLKKSVLDYMKI
jgi:hypothetical protein